MEQDSGCPFETVSLTCEYAVNPIGIEEKRPQLGWAMIHTERGQRQTAYRIVAASSTELLEADRGDLWDTGKIESALSCGIAYGGAALASGEACYWKVKVWDADGREGLFSHMASFEMGLLEPGDWKGGWIGPAGGWNGASVLLRKAFRLEKRAVKARAYVAGLGYFELRLNGSKVGDHVLDPGPTDYAKRVLYVAFDVTDRLHAGEHVVGLVLGNGWYGAPKARIQLNIELEDGSREEITTAWNWDKGWHIAQGPIVSNSIYGGETYDARLEKEGWDTADYDMARYNHRANGWITASATDGPGGELVSQTMEPIRVMGELEPIGSRLQGDKVRVYDFGQNMAGWAQLTVNGARGAAVTMRYAETLHDDGYVDQDNLRLAEATDTYILRGGGEEAYAPRFTYHGFRYVQVEIAAGQVEVERIVAQIVRSSVLASGDFACSDELVNRLHRNVWWTEASNLHGMPTDCPQRDERMAWLNDATARAEEAFYNFDMSRFYPKWLDDIADTQDERTGAIADTAPYRWGFRPADPVASCYLTIPLMLYGHYGNKNALRRHYEGMKVWNRCLEEEAEDFIVRRSYYGDWASPVVDCEPNGEGDGAVSQHTPGALVSTAHFYWNATLLSRAADILELPDEASRFAALADSIKRAFNAAFLDAQTGRYAGGGQGPASIALRFGLVPEERAAAVLAHLVRDIVDRYDYHLSTGNQCTKHMLEVLAERGQIETAYRLVTQTTYPSWGYMILNGATTVWERWELDIGNTMNSRNHPMHAHVGSWLYKYLAGIGLAQDAQGFDRIRIKPYPAGDLAFAGASLQTVKGLVAVRWQREEGAFTMQVELPANAGGTVCLPVPEGEWEISEERVPIWQAGWYVEGTAGVYGCVLKDGYAELAVGSGSYVFTVRKMNARERSA
ncbi:family 78 glycoside hydrolase catalytic domain [Cohnella sp. GCM10020058]|uniref:alpha-L-rhamnosidase n=1 Tax=Cohnella sp. GCM10020058 TaxID=3317330 RepID=UPI00363B4FE1